MTFLTANYGLTHDQITRFADAYHMVNSQMGGEIESSWYDSGWWPENPEACMIECLVDADRLERYIDDYMDWCFDFRMKQELAHDLLEVRMPSHCIDYLRSQGKTAWVLVK